MKHTKILVALIFIALLYAGCRKEKDIQKSMLPEKGSTLSSALRIDTADMEKAMNRFITLTLRDSVSYCNNYEARDALLIMEAALNYNTCTPDSDYYEIGADTVSFNMDLTRLNTGEFNFPSIKMPDLWFAMLDAAEDAKNIVKFDSVNNPFNIVVDLEFTSFNPSDTSSTQTAVIRMVTYVANAPASIIGCAWGVNDNWPAFGPIYTVTGCSTASWAVKEIQKRLSPYCRGICAGTYHSNITGAYFDPYTNNASSCIPSGCHSDSYIPYSAFYFSGITIYDCLSPSMLDCETKAIQTLANCSTYKPAGASIISYQYGFGIGPSVPYYTVHNCNVTYGICHDLGGGH